MKPSKKFIKFIDLIIDDIQDELHDYEYFMELYFGYDPKEDSRNYFEMFPEPVLKQMLKTLKEINTSETVYHISQYYYMILHNFIEFKIDVIGDEFRFEGAECYKEYKEFFDFKKMQFKNPYTMEYIENYFYDLDFQTDPKTFFLLTEENKARLGFDEELFGIISGFQPHPDEITPQIVPNPVW